MDLTVFKLPLKCYIWKCVYVLCVSTEKYRKVKKKLYLRSSGHLKFTITIKKAPKTTTSVISSSCQSQEGTLMHHSYQMTSFLRPNAFVFM